MIMALVRLMRPGQWVKNSVVFAGLIFAQRYHDAQYTLDAVLAFAAFCALSSTVYIVNDLRDREADAAHPTKQDRPIAAGQVGPTAALVLALALIVIAAALAWQLPRMFILTAAVYAVLNFAYSLGLKRVAIVDVMAIALGFVLRAIAGAEAVSAAISPWLILCAMLLALFLGFGKRRAEIVALAGRATEHRRSLANYSPRLLDQLIAVTTASTVVAYAFYTLSPEIREQFHTDNMIWTLPFVLYGVFRYLYLIHREQKGGNPTRVLSTDVPLMVNGALWLLSVLVIHRYF